MLRPFIAACSLIALPSCSLLITPPEAHPHQALRVRETSEDTPMVVFSHGYHTGLTLPANALRPHLPELCENLNDEWLEFGWGDEGFYRSEEITFELVFKALCYSTPGVVHVARVDAPIHWQYHQCPIRILKLNPEETREVATFLSQTFQRTEQGELINLGPGRYGRSNFFRAEKSYFFPRSCNAWTAKGLRAGGVKIHALTAPGIMRQLPP